jgi:NAD(P)-dependent dehydrogenase (short-subunit alcohol dehydrogenase family)
MGPAWAAMEAFNRNLSAEFASHGAAVRLRSTGLSETDTIDVVFGLHAKAMGISREQFQAFVENMTHRKRSSTLAEVANVAVFLASDKASAMTGTVANLTGGMIVD